MSNGRLLQGGCGKWKVNIDRAFNHVTRWGGASFVSRDSSGNVSACGAAPLTGLISVEHAKLLTCKLAMDFALSHDFFSVWVETDAQEVCRQISEDSMPNTSVLGPSFLQAAVAADLCNS
ncbi:hypothetical protein ACLB2K_059583 [Fragaria x ananassa]